MTAASPETQRLLLTQPRTGELVRRRWRLEVFEGERVGEQVTRDAGTVIVGNQDGVDLRIEHPTVSRYHAEVRCLTEGVLVIDLDSTNGTFVGRTRIQEALVTDGGVVRFGKVTVRVVAEDDPVTVEPVQELGEAATRDPTLATLFGQLARVATTDATVLLQGETGTGKGVVARGIHSTSRRSNGPFVVIDCGAVSPTLLESELFGHRKGSFTDARDDKIGAFETAAGGTIFLDEVGELPLALQPKLLRVLEERVVQPIGESQPRPVDVRFVAATNRDLNVSVEQGDFRKDLFFRLAVVRAEIPPLRQRPADVELLAQGFVDAAGKPDLRLTVSAVATLRHYDWPGNARELRNVIARATALTDSDALGPEHLLPAELDSPDATFREAKKQVVEEFERRYVETLLARHDGNVSAAAREAGLSRPALYALIERVGLATDPD